MAGGGVGVGATAASAASGSLAAGTSSPELRWWPVRLRVTWTTAICLTLCAAAPFVLLFGPSFFGSAGAACFHKSHNGYPEAVSRRQHQSYFALLNITYTLNVTSTCDVVATRYPPYPTPPSAHCEAMKTLAPDFNATLAAMPIDTRLQRQRYRRNLARCRSSKDRKVLNCERTPPCMYLPTSGPWRDDLPLRLACRRYQRDEAWPIYDSILKRTVDTRTILDVLSLIRNKTWLVAGDSVMQHTWYAIMCALERFNLAEEAVETHSHIWRMMKSLGPITPKVGGNYERTYRWDRDGTRVWRAGAPFNVTIISPRVNAFDVTYLSPFVAISDVILTGFGLHYSPDLCSFEKALQEALPYYSRWGQEKILMVRELSSQHFPGSGHFQASLHRPTGTNRGQCAPLSQDSYANGAIARINSRWHTATCSHPNIHLVPFYNITAPLYNLHMGSGPGPAPLNKTRDCTHFCYSPLMWDIHFTDMYNVLKGAVQAREGGLLDAH